MDTFPMYVVDRCGIRRSVKFDQITDRNEKLCTSDEYGPKLDINCVALTAEVVSRFRQGISTRELDAESALVCTQYFTHHLDYSRLAARLYVNDLHKRTDSSMIKNMEAIKINAIDDNAFRISDELFEIVKRASSMVDSALVEKRDYNFQFFGYQTMAKGYLIRSSGKNHISSILDNQGMERPQHLYMRVALGIFVCQKNGMGHLVDEELFTSRVKDAIEYYHLLSSQHVSNASPTMINAGTKTKQLSSCFVLSIGDDLLSMLQALVSAGMISKWSGGISMALHGIRADNSRIKGTGGVSKGISRYIKNINELQLLADQGGNRPGAIAIYLGVDHADIFQFLSLARIKGEDAIKGLSAPDLKYALWVSDLFMERLEEQLKYPDDPNAGIWHLFSPDDSPDLHLVYGDEYRNLYNKYVQEGRYRKVVSARDIMMEAFKTWTQVGVPYVLFKDSINRKSNMKNVAPIVSSNLCCEITIPSWSTFDCDRFSKFHPGNARGGEYGVCNLSALCLESFMCVNPINGEWEMDFSKLSHAARLSTRSLNKIIDQNYYPTPECEKSNTRHRPIGIGIMGLADVLAKMRIVYGSQEACDVSTAIASCIYYNVQSESAILAQSEGSYTTFHGSPISKGLLQPDLWVEDGSLESGWESIVERVTNGYILKEDWDRLRIMVKRGVRNAYGVSFMPTATTSNIVGSNECFEPFTSNIYTRKTLAGEFIMVNRHLISTLSTMGLWSDDLRKKIIETSGSVQSIESIPKEVRNLFKTSREIHPSLTIKMCKSMAPWVCQSMSMNLFLEEPSLPIILRFLMEGWKAGLKTGLYYMHTKPAVGTQKVSVYSEENQAPVCDRNNRDCASCSV